MDEAPTVAVSAGAPESPADGALGGRLDARLEEGFAEGCEGVLEFEGEFEGDVVDAVAGRDEAVGEPYS